MMSRDQSRWPVARLGDGYSYASPQSFDFNGTWEGYAVAHPEAHLGPRQHSDMEMRFTIERIVLARRSSFDLSPGP